MIRTNANNEIQDTAILVPLDIRIKMEVISVANEDIKCEETVANGTTSMVSLSWEVNRRNFS